ncbi:hypothetical protein RCO48_37385 [Peribacillus frigoritolerans]|nr:hypothetical protein [Peribacillus frigoritolerans]
MGDPAGVRRGGSRTARGKRVPGVEINVQLYNPLKIRRPNHVNRDPHL